MTETFRAGPGLGRLSDVTIIHGDCLEALAELASDSVDAIVTDPPYGLGFMGKAWDELPPGLDWAKQCLRVLKPGGHLLAFGGTRTWHRLAVAVEDAGFEIRDSIAWLYGSGFPKSLDVSKAIDKAAGATREVIGTRPGGLRPGHQNGSGGNFANNGGGGLPDIKETAPATPEAAQWSGFGTALKPAFEPVVVARKPLVGTVAANVLARGTGALNIDACRIGTTVETWPKSRRYGGGRGDSPEASPVAFGRDSHAARTEATGEAPAGRWPANVVLDADQAAALDEQSGYQKDGVAVNRNKDADAIKPASVYGTYRNGEQPDRTYGAGGGASRFFLRVEDDAETITARTCWADEPVTFVRDGAGWRHCQTGQYWETFNLTDIQPLVTDPPFMYCAKAPKKERPVVGGVAHPTVKPLALTRWLVRLVTPPGGVVLDPFAGSGTTVEAALLEGFRVVGIEREADYLPMIQQRIARSLNV